MKSFVSFGAIVIILMIVAFEKRQDQGRKNSKVDFVFCAPTFDPATLSEGKAPLFKGLGNIYYKVSTSSRRAQQYFNQGLTLLYAFNHGEAGRSFKAAIEHDSAFAMAYWGLGMVLGPNYNAALNPTSLEEINRVMTKAVEYSVHSSPKEKGLIHALAKRFPKEEVKEMTPFSAAYAAAMKEAHERFPEDAEIIALYADALMNEHPWNLWLKNGSAQPWTPAIQSVLEKGLKKFPNHPGLNHSYIHAMEASPMVGRALPSADRLRDMLPAAGHIVHMPSHVYIRTGHYHKGVIANEKASEADSNYIAQCKVEGTYPLMYYPHNIHFLAACAFLEGNTKKALDAAWAVNRKANRKHLPENITVQHFYSIPFYVLVHLGKWEDILALPEPEKTLRYPNAIWHYSRGMAYAAKNNQDKAQKELMALKEIGKDQSLEKMLIWETNSAAQLIQIASRTLEGEIAGHQKQFGEAITLLKEAVEMENNLMYQEPPDWFFSVRYTLGHWLVQSTNFAEAERIYREDLNMFPENGWALMGLYNSLSGQKKNGEANEVKKRFDKAWQWADITITTSRVF